MSSAVDLLNISENLGVGILEIWTHWKMCL